MPKILVSEELQIGEYGPAAEYGVMQQNIGKLYSCEFVNIHIRSMICICQLADYNFYVENISTHTICTSIPYSISLNHCLLSMIFIFHNNTTIVNE